MEVIYISFLVLFVIGVALVVYERKRGSIVTDERTPGAPQTEADREAIRTEGVALNRAGGPGSGH